MKSLKERLEEKIRKESLKHSQKFVNANIFAKANSSIAFESGAASLVPLVVELAETLKQISKSKYGLQGYIEEGDNEGAHSYMSQLAFGYEADARKALQSIEKFLEGK